MSDYRIELGSLAGPNDTEKLNYLLGIVSSNDKLEITMDGNDAHKADSIIAILKNNDFDISPKGSHDDGKYHIFAHRNE
jgi:hypothetical protein